MNNRRIPENIVYFAKDKGIYQTVKKVDGWLKKLDKHIIGGVAIGKYYEERYT